MTLILGAVWRGRAIHASDRFVSVKHPKFPTGEFDPHSNKTLVLCGSDCRVVIGYSGLAFLDGKPTDQFIAEAVTGIPDLSGGGMLIGPPDRGLHYRKIRDRIEHAIVDAYRRLPQGVANQYATSVLAAGFQRKTHFPKNLHPKGVWQYKPIVFRINLKGTGVQSVELLTGLTKALREIGKEIGFFVHAIGTHVDSLRLQTNQRLASYTSLPTATAEGIMEILMDEIQETALACPQAVGSDAMGVIVDGPGNFVTSHFRLAQQAKHAELRERALTAMAPGFANLPPHVNGVPTPFVLTPAHAMYLPSFATPEPWTEHPGGFQFRISGWPTREPKPGERQASIFTGQPRKGPDGQWRTWTPPTNWPTAPGAD